MAHSIRKTPARKAAPAKAAGSKAKTATKPAAKRALLPRASAQAPRKTAKTVGKSQPAGPEPTPTQAAKAKKPKLVRDSFTIPKTEYAAIESLKKRAAPLGRAPKKSELLRAGLMVLSKLDDLAFAQALSSVPTIKTGRPKS